MHFNNSRIGCTCMNWFCIYSNTHQTNSKALTGLTSNLLFTELFTLFHCSEDENCRLTQAVKVSQRSPATKHQLFRHVTTLHAGHKLETTMSLPTKNYEPWTKRVSKSLCANINTLKLNWNLQLPTWKNQMSSFYGQKTQRLSCLARGKHLCVSSQTWWFGSCYWYIAQTWWNNEGGGRTSPQINS